MSALNSLFAAPRPVVAMEIGARHVSGVRLSATSSSLTITAHASEPLPAGVVTPALNAANVNDEAVLNEAVRAVLGRLGGARQVLLAVPDSVARVSLVRFEKVPARQQDLESLIRWQVRKSAPFQIEEAQVTFVPGAATPEGGREFVVAVARRDLVLQYESACAAAGAQAGVVDLSTFNVINAVLASPSAPSGDWLLVHVAADYISLAIVRNRDLIFFRHRGGDGEGGLADLVHQTAMYYEDRLQGAGFSRVVLAGAATNVLPDQEGLVDAESLRGHLEQRLQARVETVDPLSVAIVTDRISAGPELRDMLAPLVGLLARERAA
jgi:type IV pilus assembly protein PilM